MDEQSPQLPVSPSRQPPPLPDAARSTEPPPQPSPGVPGEGVRGVPVTQAGEVLREGADVQARLDGAGRRSGLSLVLFVIACAVLGMALSWGMRQRGEASRLLGKMDVMRTQLALSAAGDSDLAMLMTGESSERVAMQAQSPEARGSAALIWDRKLGKGMLFCQGLWPAGAGERYHLWLGSAGPGNAGLTRVAGFDAQADSTVVRFHAPEVERPVRFVISAEAEGSRNEPGKVLFIGRGS